LAIQISWLVKIELQWKELVVNPPLFVLKVFGSKLHVHKDYIAFALLYWKEDA